ncbi:MAG: hypothetical protein EZS28_009283 [Streblomastix strix]|uniref:Uncharacterized protein n=1 Tax=Streblomastix strix TaxID=222440 RepID=A0A5J4WJD9_9EUKA|nr:MAG: hypothetical protein EZS28_009283 [Streblomastix strix]
MLLVSQVVAKSAGFYVMLDPFYELIEQLPAFPCISAAWFPIDLTNHWDEILTVLQRSRYVQPNNPELRLMLRCYSQSYGDIPVGNNIGVRVNGVPVFAPFQANVQQIIMTIIPKPPQTHCSILLDITDYIIAPISFIEVQMQRNIIDLAVVPMLMKR